MNSSQQQLLGLIVKYGHCIFISSSVFKSLSLPLGRNNLLEFHMCEHNFTLSILWHFLSLGLEWKLTFSSPMASAEFSKFAGILSAALSQHHLSGFERAQLELPPLALFVVMLSKANLTSHSRMSGSRSVITPSWLSGSWRSFLYSSVLFLPPLLNIFCFC